MLQFAYIAGPLVLPQRLLGRRSQIQTRDSVFGRKSAAKQLREQQDVLASLAKRWQVKGYDLQPVIQIFPELAFADQRLNAAVGGGDETDVDAPIARLADSSDRVGLQGAQKLGLQRRGQIGDLVQKERAPVGRREHAGLVIGRPAEGAPRVSKQLRFEQLRRHGTAIQRNERPGAVFQGRVYVVCEEVLARAGLTGQENGGHVQAGGDRPRGQPVHLLADGDDARTVADQLDLPKLFRLGAAVLLQASAGM